MKKLLVTGSAGFIGSNFLEFILSEASDDLFVVSLDKLTYAGDKKNLGDLLDHPRHEFVEGDICDDKLLASLFEKHQFQGVVHFAAESHVDNSIEGPEAFAMTNVMGTFRLLEAARRLWLEAPGKIREGFEGARFHHVSTDEVYGSLGDSDFFTEDTAYDPSSPYSASKAASDHFVRAYYKTYGLNVVITNCSNNYGPKQHWEKLIPTVLRRAISGEKIPIYGTGQNVRDWLYVEDHCRAIGLVFETGEAGETYNIGTRNEMTNLQLCNLICEQLDGLKPRAEGGSYKEQISFVKDRPGHDFRYAIDPSRIELELGFKPLRSMKEGLQATIRWYLERLDTEKQKNIAAS